MASTQFAEKFRAAGVLSRDVVFRRAIALYLNNGGTVESARRIIDDIAGEMGGEGQSGFSDVGQVAVSNAALQNDDGGDRFMSAEVANTPVFPSSSPNSSAGQGLNSDKDTVRFPDAATQRDRAGQCHLSAKASALAPSPVSPSYIGAARKASVQVARSILDSYKVRDGRSIGDVTFGELDKMRRDGLMDASLFMQLQRHAANATPNQKVRDIVNADTLNRMVQKAAEVAEAS